MRSTCHGRRLGWAAGVWWLATLLACGAEGESPAGRAAAPDVVTAGSPNAKPGFAARQRPQQGARHASDGGGRAWLVEPAPDVTLVAGSEHRFTIAFEAGPLGVAEGGTLLLQIPPFWGWSPPQVSEPDAPGHVVAACDVEGVALEVRPVGRRRVAVRLRERRLAPGERLRITYGAGPARARIDRFAEEGSAFWLAVDGDGDRHWEWLEDPPRVDVVAGLPAGLVLLGPGSASVGDVVTLRLALLDGRGNAGIPFEGHVELSGPPELEVPPGVSFGPGDRGGTLFAVGVRGPGVHRLRAATRDATGRRLEVESNPLVVRDGAPRLLWGDLHGHSALSDGTGTPEAYFRYARDVAALDVAALTDHDRWGVRFLDERPEAWEGLLAAAGAYHEPERFVALPGFEWTSWIHGHRHVLYFAERGPLISVGDEATSTPDGLWRALAGQPALTFAHHPAGEPVATNWAYPPDPELEPVIEIASSHGSAEAADTPHPVRGGLEGWFVRDLLGRGLRLGFVGSGDSHDGHPGLAHLTSRDAGGLAGIWSDRLTREGVLDALRRRRVYATNGPRIWLWATLDGAPAGSAVDASVGVAHRVAVEVAAPAPLARVELIRGDAAPRVLEPQGARDWSWQGAVPALPAGGTLYVRVVQEDGGAAWSSPFFAE